MIRLSGTHRHLTGCCPAYARTAGTVNSQAVEATWTDDPVNNSQDRAGTGAAPAGGARNKARASSAALRKTDGPSHARGGVTPSTNIPFPFIGKGAFRNPVTGKGH